MKRITDGDHLALSPSGHLAQSRAKGVRGWLLVLCLMLVAIGPAISVALVADSFGRFAPYFGQSMGLRVAITASMVVTASSVAFGIHAGLGLWLIRPRAVPIAKLALLLGLAADIVTTAIETTAWHAMTGVDISLFRDIVFSVIPGLVFFTACFAYLVGSDRVYATYRPH